LAPFDALEVGSCRPAESVCEHWRVPAPLLAFFSAHFAAVRHVRKPALSNRWTEPRPLSRPIAKTKENEHENTNGANVA
jgi:hypothetical protein